MDELTYSGYQDPATNYPILQSVNDSTLYYFDPATQGWVDSNGSPWSGGNTSNIVDQAAAGNPTAMSTLDKIIAAMPQIGAGISALQLSQINVSRAKMNLPPLSSAYNPGINVGLSGNTMMYIALGLGAVLLLSKSGSRR